MSRRDPNSVSGVKMLVLGGSSRSIAATAALRTTGGAAVPGRGVIAATRPGPAYSTSYRLGT